MIGLSGVVGIPGIPGSVGIGDFLFLPFDALLFGPENSALFSCFHIGPVNTLSATRMSPIHSTAVCFPFTTVPRKRL